MRGMLGTVLRMTAAMGLGAMLLSCGSEKDDDSSSSCTDVRCYGVCQGNAWVDMDESYWVFEAFCVDETTCNCLSYCDDDQCDSFCREEGIGSRGTCDFLSCVCTGAASDAGADASPDAAE